MATDATTGATPLAVLSEGSISDLPTNTEMFLGFIGGSMGEVSAVALLIGGLFLIYKKIISPIIPACFIGTVFVFALIYYTVIGGDMSAMHMAIFHICAGGVMLGAFFCATDYVTSPIMGLGDCEAACDYDAIHVCYGVAVVNRDKCVGCGVCAKKCPNSVIRIAPAKNKVVVQCNSKAGGAVTRKTCTNGCIGCKKCEKACKFDAVHVENNLAMIDPEKCKNCGLCAKECPTGAINNMRLKKAATAPKAETAEKTEAAEA